MYPASHAEFDVVGASFEVLPDGEARVRSECRHLTENVPGGVAMEFLGHFRHWRDGLPAHTAGAWLVVCERDGHLDGDRGEKAHDRRRVLCFSMYAVLGPAFPPS